MKERMQRESMKSTGSLWFQQMLIQYLTKNYEDAATRQDSGTRVEATDQGLPKEQQLATGLLGYDPEDSANKIIQLACEQ